MNRQLELIPLPPPEQEVLLPSQEPYVIYNTDAVVFLSRLPDESIDLAITDPPYESLEKHRKVGTTTRLKKEWFEIFPNSRFEELFHQIYRVLKKNTHFYMMCDAETMFVAKPIAESVGFRFWKPLVWDKVAIGMGYHYRARHEFILFFEKGKRKLNDLSIPDVLEHKRVYRGYPTEKPAGLMEQLVLQSSQPGEIVCDPFMGAGSTGVAALRNERLFVGNDLSAKAFLLAESRLSEYRGENPLLGSLQDAMFEEED